MHPWRDTSSRLARRSAFRSRGPAEGSFDDPSPRQHQEALLVSYLVDDLESEVLVSSQTDELAAIVGAIGEEVLEPGPALADRLDDELGAGGILDIGGGQVKHQQVSVGVHGDVPLAVFGLLAGVVPTATRRAWRLDRLAVQHARTRTGFAALQFPIYHHQDVMDRPEQKAAQQPAKPPVNRLPRREMGRQKPPSAVRPRQVPQCIEDLAHIHRDLPPALRRRREQRLDVLPLRITLVRRIALALKLFLSFSMLFRPHTP